MNNIVFMICSHRPGLVFPIYDQSAIHVCELSRCTLELHKKPFVLDVCLKYIYLCISLYLVLYLSLYFCMYYLCF